MQLRQYYFNSLLSVTSFYISIKVSKPQIKFEDVLPCGVEEMKYLTGTTMPNSCPTQMGCGYTGFTKKIFAKLSAFERNNLVVYLRNGTSLLKLVRTGVLMVEPTRHCGRVTCVLRTKADGIEIEVTINITISMDNGRDAKF